MNSESSMKGPIKTVLATNWIHLHELLFEDAHDDSIDRYRLKYAFRGVSCAEYLLEPSLMRLGGEYWKMEQHLLRNFQKYAHESIVGKNFVWHWLSIAQHHGMPTRFLDWTYSPYVAMHFATASLDKYNKNAAIWKVNYDEVHKSLPKKAQNLMGKTVPPTIVFTVDMLQELYKTIEDFDGDAPAEKPYALFFEPPAIDERVINQYAYFSVISNPHWCMSRWLESQTASIATKIIIPKELKWEIRDKLDQNNISERVLFPGLDGLCKWLGRRYLLKDKKNGCACPTDETCLLRKTPKDIRK